MVDLNNSLNKQLKERGQLFEQVVTDVHDAIQPLVDQVEVASPGHNFGQRVINHMLGLSTNATSLVNEMNLGVEDAQLLELCLAIHDIGRVLCQAEKPGDRAYQHTHGAVGANYLRDNGFLEKLTSEDAQVILDVVEQHALKEITLSSGTLSHTICNIVRDLDREELLSGVAVYLSPEGALKQMDMWMLSEDAKGVLQEATEQDKVKLQELIQPVLLGEQAPNLSATESPLALEIFEHLTRTIPADYIQKVAKGEQLSKEEMITGYPAYMLSQIAIAINITTPGVRANVAANDSLGARTRYLELVAPPTHTLLKEVSQKFNQ